MFFKICALSMKFKKMDYFVKIRLDRFAFIETLDNLEQAVINRPGSFPLCRVLNTLLKNRKHSVYSSVISEPIYACLILEVVRTRCFLIAFRNLHIRVFIGELWILDLGKHLLLFTTNDNLYLQNYA